VIKESNLKWWVFFAASLVLVMTNIDFSAVNLALAPIANDFHTNLSALVWIINGYSSAAAAFVLIGGRLGDIYGYRKIFAGGVLIFTVSSALIGCASGAWDLILFRIIQGAGGSLCWPLCVVMISNAFPENQKGHAIGMSMAIATIALAMGPAFGGVLLHYLNWRWIFFINIPFGILAFVLAFHVIPITTRVSDLSLHLFSAILIIVSLFMITTALNEAIQWGLSSLLFQVIFGGGIVLLGIFIWMQSKIKNPLVNLNLLKDKTLNICLILRVFNQITLVSILFTLSLLFQNILNYSPLTSSFLLLPLTLALSVAAFIGGKLVDKFGSKKLIMLGMSLCLIALIGFTLNNNASILGYILPLIIAGMGIGLNVPSLVTAILRNAAPENRGIIGGLNYASIFVGGGLAMVMSGWILHAQSLISVDRFVKQFPNSIHLNQIPNLQLILSGAKSIQFLGVNSFIPFIQQLFIHAFSIVMWVTAAISALSVILVLRLKKNV